MPYLQGMVTLTGKSPVGVSGTQSSPNQAIYYVKSTYE